ncbi:unnamed protein product [Nezara viridula]|uniref:Uncharacterized protein n=1 Tax=Nezara viridula TaxID=85310 RepID=A0A9P0MQ63_NEZVI|nr:unnamed protein product [Nezara viridula]
MRTNMENGGLELVVQIKVIIPRLKRPCVTCTALGAILGRDGEKKKNSNGQLTPGTRTLSVDQTMYSLIASI